MFIPRRSNTLVIHALVTPSTEGFLRLWRTLRDSIMLEIYKLDLHDLAFQRSCSESLQTAPNSSSLSAVPAPVIR